MLQNDFEERVKARESELFQACLTCYSAFSPPIIVKCLVCSIAFGLENCSRFVEIWAQCIQLATTAPDDHRTAFGAGAAGLEGRPRRGIRGARVWPPGSRARPFRGSDHASWARVERLSGSRVYPLGRSAGVHARIGVTRHANEPLLGVSSKSGSPASAVNELPARRPSPVL
jgi:hypothetical protein